MSTTYREWPIFWPQPPRRFWLTALIIAATINAGLMLAAFFAPKYTIGLVPAEIRAEEGRAFTYPLSISARFPWQIASDIEGGRSVLSLAEDSRTLTPAHALHAEIRLHGDGAYSHWGNSLYFSSTDGSDPHTNGRRYTITVSAGVDRSLVNIVLAADGMLATVFIRAIIQLFGRWGHWIWRLGLVLGAFVLWLTASGVFGRVNADAGLPLDATLARTVACHAALGVAVAGIQWLIGAGIARLLLSREATPASILLLGYSLSIPLTAVIVAIALIAPFGKLVAGVMILACLLPLAFWRPDSAAFGRLFETGLAAVPCAVAFGSYLGLLWHGPTATLPGSASGDMTFYGASVASLASTPFPFWNFGHEGDRLSYLNDLFPAIGASLHNLPGFDPILFITTAGAAFLVFSLAIALSLYVEADGTASRAGFQPRAIAVLALLVANRYPSWTVESIPVAQTIPLVVCLWALSQRASGHPLAAFGTTAQALVGTALTKVTAALVLVPISALAFPKSLIWADRRTRVLAIGAGAVVGAYAAYMIARFGPYMVGSTPLGPDSWTRFSAAGFHWTVLPTLMRDIATVPLAIAAFRLARPRVALVVAAGLTCGLVYSWLLRIDVVCAVIVIGLLCLDEPQRLARCRALLLMGLTLSAPAIFFDDEAGPQIGVIWLICVGGAVAIAVMPAANRRRAAFFLGAGLLAATAGGLVAVGRGLVVVVPDWAPGAVLTPEVRDIWRAVRDKTPKDALIFTDQTGSDTSLVGGWNTYAFTGERQVFLANWYQTPSLRENLNLRDRVIAENATVLAGREAPTDLRLSRCYSAYFAVISREAAVPSQASLTYENAAYRLYKLALKPLPCGPDTAGRM
jgi:hypothetical protein